MSIQNSHQISDVKILLKQGATGASIVSITKTGTSGLVDTYTVATSDGGRYTFEVTNGSDIQSIEKTSSHGEVDTYTVTLTNGNTTTFEVTNGDNWIDNSEKTATDAFQTITGGLLKMCKVALSPVQSGSGDPSPTNVRPITGHTQVKVSRLGKNLYNANALSPLETAGITATINNGEITLNGTATSNAYYTIGLNLPVGNYRYSMNNASASSVRVAFADLQNNYFLDSAIDAVNKVFVVTSHSIRILTIYVPSGVTVDNYKLKPQLEKGTSATSFEPYTGTTYTVEIPSGTGTVYGGTLDLVSGQLAITKEIKALNVQSVGTSGAGVRYADCPYTGQNDVPAISNMYKQIGSGSQGYSGAFKVYNVAVTFYDDRFTDVATAQSILNNCQVVIDILSPVVVQLTPTQVETLIGDNNLLCPLAGQAMVEDGVKYFYIYTYKDLMEGLQNIADALEDDVTEITNNAVEEVSEMAGVWTTPASASVGDTSITISDASITTSSIIEVYCQNASGNPISITNMAVTTGQAVLSFYALAEATSFRLHVLN